MRMAIAIAAAGAMAFGGLAASASAATDVGQGYGSYIKESCGMSFGQLRQASPHPVTPSAGAKAFAMNGVAIHCPSD